MSPAAPGAVLRDLHEHHPLTTARRDEQIVVRAAMLRGGLERAGIGPALAVDLGCGGAENTVGLEEAVPGLRTVGLDWGLHWLRTARARGAQVAAGTLDPAALPFASAACDAVTVCEVIEHLVDTDGLLDEVQRILRPGGVLLVTTPNLAAWFNRLLLAAGTQPVFTEVSSRRIYGRPGTEVVGHLRVFTAKALREFLEGAGFEDVRLAGTPYHDVPRVARPLDRLLARWPTVAASLVAVARKPMGPDALSTRSIEDLGSSR